MTEETSKATDIQRLQLLAELREQPFHSDVPVIGGLIAAFRSAWNSVSTKWYVRPMMAQQTEFNQFAADLLGELDARSRELPRLADELDRRIAAQDREQTQLVHDLGETSARIAQLRSMLTSLEETATTGKR